ncbi:MAG: YkoF family thiamine/hydroxymethylpyrimidine-binding protein [Anaerolineae bacterium]
MGMVSAQVSLYPLRQPSIGPAIREAVRTLREQGLRVQMGPMSTLVWGEEKVVFSALREAFRRAAEEGDIVMVITLSNACPTLEES